jgi:hypothetical protein
MNKGLRLRTSSTSALFLISAFLSSDLTMLETIGDNEVSRFLRDSGISFNAIPQSKLTEAEINKLKGYYKWKNRIEKMVFLNEIKGKMLSVPLYSVLKRRGHFEETKYGIFLTMLEYNSDTGLNLRKGLIISTSAKGNCGFLTGVLQWNRARTKF